VRVTLDSNILVRAVTSPHGPAFRLLDIVLIGHTLVLSAFILDEVERVLLYPRIQLRYRITAAEGALFASNLARAAHMVVPRIVSPLVPADPEDDQVLYTAADGNADILCTLNVRRFSGAPVEEFCAQRGIRIMTDIETLRELERRPQD
jgi:putative PIN family toxin of toxin-antitoxin system